mmetsp:Transcript_57582/g.64403  ORF Transcript_57582/g.64403 Transcript_57582/m.64403 type:complete len:138 (+) Transcript_57582:704-1117(+)
MGRNANAKKDQSMVINLGTEEATSTKKGEFLVSSNVITFQIGTKKASINDKNFNKFFKKVLKKNPENRRRRHLKHTLNDDDDQQANIIEELHSQVNAQQEQIHNQQEQIHELHRMMIETMSLLNDNNTIHHKTKTEA